MENGALGHPEGAAQSPRWEAGSNLLPLGGPTLLAGHRQPSLATLCVPLEHHVGQRAGTVESCPQPLVTP